MIETIKISADKNITTNDNYLGCDEDHNGDFNDYFQCPSCKENNYIEQYTNNCSLCGINLEWVEKKGVKIENNRG